MEHFYYYNELLKDRPAESEILDLLKIELDQKIYSYGGQFRTSVEAPVRVKALYRGLRQSAGYALKLLKICRYAMRGDGARGASSILSSAYFSANQKLREMGFSVFSPPWGGASDSAYLPDIEVFRECKHLRRALSSANFAELLTERMRLSIENFSELFTAACRQNDFSALILPHDLGIWERISLQSFHDIGRPSFVFLHGLPGRYNQFDESRSDYLVVWGPKIKENYIKAGHDPSRIFVSGHPNYSNPPESNLLFSTKDILVLTKSMNGGQHSAGTILSDRGNLLMYLFSVQSALSKIGVKSVRLRPHPSESPDWYRQHLDGDFFRLDDESLVQSLHRSTLVIGPTSTVMLEAVYHGVNYLVYEPVYSGLCVDNYPPVPPFDGSDSRIPVAKNDEDLMTLLRERRCIETSFWKDYIQSPFDIGFIKELI